MAQLSGLEYGARQTVQSVRRNPAFEKLTRIGFAAKGVVYSMIGVLAFKSAIGNGGETTDKNGAINRIAAQPFGEFAVIVIGVGLLAYAAWRLLCAFADVEHEGSDRKAMFKRIGYGLSGLLHASAGVYCFRLVAGDGGGQGNGAQTWTARILDLPGGELLLALIGFGVIAAGAMQIRKGWSEKFRKHLQEESNSEWVRTAGKWGYVARGVVFGVIGFLVILAAIRHDPSRVNGVEGALDMLSAQPWLLAAVAAGLVCYGVYCFIEARYRRVNT